MPLVEQIAAPSMLADVIQQVIDAFDAEGDATPIQVGKTYVDHAGVAPRVVFVPLTDGNCEFAGVELGDAGKIVEGCSVLVQSAPGGTDVERLSRVGKLARKVFAHIQNAGSGRVGGGQWGDASPIDSSEYGAAIVFKFTFTNAVRHDAERLALPPAPIDANASPQPLIPPGQLGQVEAIDVTVEPAVPA